VRTHSVQSRRFSKEKLRIVHPSNHHRQAWRPRDLLSWIVASALLLAGAGLKAQEGSPEAGQGKSVTCGACHGADGNSITATLGPSLAGQHARYIERQLQAYKAAERANAGMQGYASALSDQDMADIAAYFAEQQMAVKGADPAFVENGERIYRGGIPERGIAACIACHGPNGMGNPLSGYPRVSHQHAEYLSQTLRDYRAGIRRSDATLNQMMRNVAEMLLDDEIAALASYMQGLN
jgi:cytochrome c553